MLHLLSIFIDAVKAQQPTCQTGTNQVPFNACIRNALYGPLSVNSFASPETACSEIQSGTYQFYQCLCDKTSAFVYCFDTFCAGSDGVVMYSSSRTEYCASAAALRPASATVVSLPPLRSTATSAKSVLTPSDNIASVTSKPNGADFDGIDLVLGLAAIMFV